MFTNHRLTTLAVTVIGAAAVGVAAAGSAAANTADDNFLAQISSHGITYDSAQDAVNAGRDVCQELAAGKTGTQIEQEFTHLSPSSAAYFVGSAVGAYCPQYA